MITNIIYKMDFEMKRAIFVITTALLMMTTANAAPDSQGKRPDFGNLCQGKAVNSKVTAKHGDRTIEGTCQIGFKATNPNALDRGASRDPAIQNACKAKAKGSAVVAKLNGKNIAGKCDINFKPNMRR